MALVSVRPSDMIKEESFEFGKSARGEGGGGERAINANARYNKLSSQHSASSNFRNCDVAKG